MVILNVTPRSVIGDIESVGDTWDSFDIREEQIVDVWKLLYGESSDNDAGRSISYFDWLEKKYGLELIQIVRKDKVAGDGAHGYYPIDVCCLMDCLKGYDIDSKKDRVIDFGAGKGSGAIALRACGFNDVGAIEYTSDIFEGMISNFEKLGWNHKRFSVGDTEFSPVEDGVSCWEGDAGKLGNELDSYNWFYFFNPFDTEILNRVLHNIELSVERRPRKTYIIYVEPMGHKAVLKSGKYKLKDTFKNDYYHCVMWFYIYESV